MLVPTKSRHLQPQAGVTPKEQPFKKQIYLLVALGLRCSRRDSLLQWGTGSRESGLSSCARGLGCPVAYRILVP